jgi:hypothetical protein
MALPWRPARPPAGDGTQVGVVVSAELTAKCRLFVPVNESRNGEKERPSVEQQQRLSQYECCPTIVAATAKYIGFLT